MIKPELQSEVADCLKYGCQDWSGRLGIATMPEGYALILNPDGSHFFWLRHDGAESPIHWDKWAIYRGAKINKDEAIK